MKGYRHSSEIEVILVTTHVNKRQTVSRCGKNRPYTYMLLETDNSIYFCILLQYVRLYTFTDITPRDLRLTSHFTIIVISYRYNKLFPHGKLLSRFVFDLYNFFVYTTILELNQGSFVINLCKFCHFYYGK